MPRAVLAESSPSNFGVVGARRRVLGIASFVFVVVLAGLTIGCSSISELQAATNSANQAAANKKNPITVSAQVGKATQGTPYSGKISASGGLAPYHFWIRSGALPVGLTLNP